jgi:hypothetical protein
VDQKSMSRTCPVLASSDVTVSLSIVRSENPGAGFPISALCGPVPVVD